MEVCSDDDEVIEGEKSVFIEEDSSNTVDGIIGRLKSTFLSETSEEEKINIIEGAFELCKIDHLVEVFLDNLNEVEFLSNLLCFIQNEEKLNPHLLALLIALLKLLCHRFECVMALQGLDIVSTLFNLTKRLTSSLRFESVDIHHLVALDLLNIWEMTAGASVRGANQMSQMGAPEAICDLVTSHEPNILVITASLMAHLAIIIGSNAPKNRFLVISNFVAAALSLDHRDTNDLALMIFDELSKGDEECKEYLSRIEMMDVLISRAIEADEFGDHFYSGLKLLGCLLDGNQSTVKQLVKPTVIDTLMSLFEKAEDWNVKRLVADCFAKACRDSPERVALCIDTGVLQTALNHIKVAEEFGQGCEAQHALLVQTLRFAKPKDLTRIVLSPHFIESFAQSLIFHELEIAQLASLSIPQIVKIGEQLGNLQNTSNDDFSSPTTSNPFIEYLYITIGSDIEQLNMNDPSHPAVSLLQYFEHSVS